MASSAQPQAADGKDGQAVTAPAGNGTTAAATTEDGAEKQSKTQLAVGSLPESVKNALILARQRNIVLAEIASTNWGKGLDLETRRAISDWSQRVGLDPATELDVLGGRFYKNSQYYLRKLSEMIEAGVVEYAYVDHIEVDHRLDIMAKRTDRPELARHALEEIDRRTMARIAFKAPDAAEGISVARVKLHAIGREFSGCKWCGGGTRKSDPVGNEFPIETSESRSWRRVMRLIASQNPAFKPMIETNDDDDIDAQIGGSLRAGLKRAKVEQMSDAEAMWKHTHHADGTPKKMSAPSDNSPWWEWTEQMPAQGADDPYSMERAQPAIGAPVPIPDVIKAPTMQAEKIVVPPAAPLPAGGVDTIGDPYDPPLNDMDILTPEERFEHEQALERRKSRAAGKT